MTHRVSLIAACLICSAVSEVGFANDVDPLASSKAVASLGEQTEKITAKRFEEGFQSSEFGNVPLTKTDAENAFNILWGKQRAFLAEERAAEMESKLIRHEGKEMRFEYRILGDKPVGGRSLFLSMHGGGGAPARVNDGQWRNQIRLYEPKEGVYVAPRAPTNTWNLWHQPHIDPMFDRLIENCIALHDVNPDRVYLMGYSAGGDGVFQLAPRMADRWAATAMMAGHPNGVSPKSLRNVAFALHMGEFDSAYNRNKIAAQWKEKLANLRKSDPMGYIHEVTIHQGKGHWMDRQDAVAVDWMQKHTRDLYASKIVRHNVKDSRFYWTKVADTAANLVFDLQGQTITITGEKPPAISLYLHDEMLDLDQNVTVRWNATELFSGSVPRTISALHQSLRERPGVAFSAVIAWQPPE